MTETSTDKVTDLAEAEELWGRFLGQMTDQQAAAYTLNDFEDLFPGLAATMQLSENRKRYGDWFCDLFSGAIIDCLRMRVVTDREAELFHRGFFVGMAFALAGE